MKAFIESDAPIYWGAIVLLSLISSSIFSGFTVGLLAGGLFIHLGLPLLATALVWGLILQFMDSPPKYLFRIIYLPLFVLWLIVQLGWL